jgi:hypothetical protein
MRRKPADEEVGRRVTCSNTGQVGHPLVVEPAQSSVAATVLEDGLDEEPINTNPVGIRGMTITEAEHPTDAEHLMNHDRRPATRESQRRRRCTWDDAG